MKYLNRTILKKRLVSIVNESFADFSKFQNNFKFKEDKSLVTKIDIEVSELIKEATMEHRNLTSSLFYSEEDHTELNFPAFILDPIDGTKELARGVGECCLSLAYMASNKVSDPENSGWVFNPFTGHEMLTGNEFYPQMTSGRDKLSCLVSRSEYECGLFNDSEEDCFYIVPRGSIAFKLSLLAAGACDFVITKKPKSIWDIAAGTMLCNERGISLYSKNNEIKTLDSKRIDGPLLWCAPINRDKVLEGLNW